MTTLSSLFEWQKVPEAILKNDLITLERKSNSRDYVESLFYPAEYSTELLNAIRLVYDCNDALNFVHNWGFLNHRVYNYELMAPIASEEKSKELNYIREYLFHTKRLTEDLSIDYLAGVNYKLDHSRIFTEEEKYNYHKIQGEVADNLNLVYNPQITYKKVIYEDDDNVFLILKNSKPEYRLNGMAKNIVICVWGESVNNIIAFAQHIRDLSMVFRLTQKYSGARRGNEDYEKVDFEMDEWLNTNPDFFPFSNPKFLAIQKISYSKYPKTKETPTYNEVLLDFALQACRSWVSLELKGGTYVQINQEVGHPQINFADLYSFILYNITAESALTPERCFDPKCNQLFFPSRKKQKYCPPLPWEKRSRCEQRHSKAERRKIKKNNREK